MALLGIPRALLPTLAGFLILFLARLLVRREWLAGVVCTILFVASVAIERGNLAAVIPLGVLAYGSGVAVLLRYGLLAAGTGVLVTQTLAIFLATNDFGVWYAGSTIFGLTIVVALGVFGFHSTLAGRPLLKHDLLED
jgi:hypothetical protein